MTLSPVAERTAEPIRGWRVWNLWEDLAGQLRLYPVGSGSGAWEPRQVVRARCTPPPFLGLLRRPHAAPDPSCRCGIYAARSLEAFDRPRPAYPPPAVVGTVSMWGRIVEHERGWRSAQAYPAQLRLVCSMCAWFEPGPGVPRVVHRFARLLYTLCDAHRGGIQLPDGRRSAPTDLDPLELEARLLDAYAVEVVPWDRVEVLFRFPRTADPPPYKPTIRVVPAT